MPFSRTKLMEEYIDTALFVHGIVEDDCDALVDSIFLKFVLLRQCLHSAS